MSRGKTKEQLVVETLSFMNKAAERISDILEMSKTKNSRGDFTFALKAMELLKQAKSDFLDHMAADK